MGMVDEYFEIYNNNIKQYGENTVILYACGSFYEIYEIDNDIEKIGNAKRMSIILDMTYANKKGDTSNSTRTFPNFIGFTTSILSKYLTVLLRNDFTVVIVDQLECSSEKKGKLVKRGITKIYSPSLLPLDINEEDCNLVSLIFDIDEPIKKSIKKNSSFIQNMNISICCINNNNNNTEITENIFSFLPNDSYTLNLSLESISRILYRYNPKELQIGFVNNLENMKDIFEQIKRYFTDNYENIRLNDIDYLYKDEKYQNKYLKETYQHINFGLINPVEYMNLKNLSAINMLFILNFIEKHDVSYIKNLVLPKFIIEDNFLVLELNTLVQLNILSKQTQKHSQLNLFDIIDNTKTAIGKRHLKNLLCKPFKDSNIINKRYQVTNELSVLNLDKILNDISDIEKLHRKMGISELHQYEFVKLNNSYNEILKLVDVLNTSDKLKELILDDIFDNVCLVEFKNYIDEYNKTFDLIKMNNFNLNSGKDVLENYFNKGVVKELDIIQNKINILQDKRENLRISFDKLINKTENDVGFIKLTYTDFEGYSFSCTKIRYQTLLTKLNKDKCKDWRVKQTNNSVKFVPIELEKLSNEILANRELLCNKITINYKNKLLEYYRKYNYIFNKLKTLIEIVDVCNSNLKCSKKHNYTMPEIKDNVESYLETEQLRHPIIERLGKEYITNDISLDNNTNGILLYGLNSSGKSSLLRAIGINLIMAQCGLFVPCKSFKFKPFDNIISQVDLTDDLFNGKSSYINEMMGLKRILQCSNSNTLVLCDEMCKGTESISSTALVSAVILALIKKSTKFFLTTHLHDISKIDEIKRERKLNINHLSVLVKNEKIIFERKLKEGSGSDLYGLEVAKNLLESPELIDKAFEIRNILTKNNYKIKKSVYNKKKILEKCEICGSSDSLETDHIKEQMTANDKGFLEKGISKNHISNLCCLCKKCHLKKTLGKIKIHGYKTSLDGEFLDWE